MKTFILLFSFCFAIATNAQTFPPDTIYSTVYIDSFPVLPGLYDTLSDNSVPGNPSIIRITDYVQEWDWYPVFEYAKTQPWNADASMYKFYSVAIYNGTDFSLIRELPGSDIYPSYWSNTNPDLIYSFRENGEIKKYFVSTDSIAVVDTITGYDAVKLGPGEGNIDIYDRYVALACKKDTDLYVVVYNLQDEEISGNFALYGAWGNGSNDFPQYVDWISVSQSGNYIGIMWDHNNCSASNPFNGHYGVEIYNTHTLEFERRIAEYGNHGDFGFASDGREVYVQFWGTDGTVNAYYLDSCQHFAVLTSDDFIGEGHISCRNINRPGWAYISMDDSTFGVNIAVKLDGSGTVEYFGHHFSSASNYVKSPMAVPNPDGSMVMFRSDFGHWNNEEEVYCFVAKANNTVTQVTHAGYDVNDKIIIYPVPAKNIIYIKSPKEKVKEIRLYTVTGQLIKTVKADYCILNGLDNGCYIAGILLENGITVFKKIFKQ